MSPEDFMPLPHPVSSQGRPTDLFKDRKKEDLLLDGISALGIPKPKNKEEEKKWIDQFLSGLSKLLSRKDNWTFWQPLVHTLKAASVSGL